MSTPPDPGPRGAQPPVPAAAEQPALRQLALAAAVLDDVDLEPYGDGVVLRDGPPVEVTWAELRDALDGADPESSLARRRATRHLRGRRILAGTPVEELVLRARPVGYPVDAREHPGLDWVRQRVLGDVLDLGLGVVGLAADPERMEVLPPGCLSAAEVDPTGWWPAARRYLDRMGALAAARLRRGGSVLRPMGDCDVVTLLGSPELRATLAGGDSAGMAAVAVPMRRRGWADLARLDPAFVMAAAAATEESERGFARPLLVTADEVALAPAGGRPADLDLRDPAPSSHRQAALRGR